MRADDAIRLRHILDAIQQATQFLQGRRGTRGVRSWEAGDPDALVLQHRGFRHPCLPDALVSRTALGLRDVEDFGIHASTGTRSAKFYDQA